MYLIPADHNLALRSCTSYRGTPFLIPRLAAWSGGGQVCARLTFASRGREITREGGNCVFPASLYNTTERGLRVVLVLASFWPLNFFAKKSGTAPFLRTLTMLDIRHLWHVQHDVRWSWGNFMQMNLALLVFFQLHTYYYIVARLERAAPHLFPALNHSKRSDNLRQRKVERRRCLHT